MSNKIILDLCGGTGSWSKPYKENGYDVKIITYPEYDVNNYIPPANVYGILAAPPCTDFSVACNRHWNQKDNDGRTEKSLQIVKSCLRIIEQANPKFWALENPVGRLPQYIGKYKEIYNIAHFGSDYQKKLCLWGTYTPFMRIFSENYQALTFDKSDHLFQKLPVGYKADHNNRAAKRSITFFGFALAFFEANR